MRTREGRNIDVEVLLRWIAEARSLPPNRDAGESATNISVSFWRELRLMKTVRSVVLRVSEAMEGLDPRMSDRASSSASITRVTW